MRTLLRFAVTSALFATATACADSGDEPGSADQSKQVAENEGIAEDERGSVGPGSPASKYCEKLGYRIEGEECIFPDGTRCEQWNFYRAICGQAYSFCAKNGGTIASESADAGGFTTVSAVCTLNGVRCSEQDFADKGKCE